MSNRFTISFYWNRFAPIEEVVFCMTLSEAVNIVKKKYPGCTLVDAHVGYGKQTHLQQFGYRSCQ